MSISENDYMKAYSLNVSQKKLNQVDKILQRKLGEDWKKTLFTVLIILVAIIALIIFGINTTESPYNKSFSHMKVFTIITLVSISFFLVWVIIKPNITNQEIGIVPFPPGDTLVPVDQTMCGIIPLECRDGQRVCNEKCTETNSNQSSYGCRTVTHPNTYYLGTKLEKGKKYCLPRIAQYDSIGGCSTYTGRIVWSKNPDGTLGWRCQCLYPDLFSGEKCNIQIACQKNVDDRSPPSPLMDNSGNVWSANQTPPSNTTPYDSLKDDSGNFIKDANGNVIPRFKCKCNDSGFYSLNSDPFSCNQDVCYAGDKLSDTAKLDMNTMKCLCDNQLTYKSNISGFCYPIQQSDKMCNLNKYGDGCMYGVDFFPPDTGVNTPENMILKRVLYKNGEKYYISDLHKKNTFVFNTPSTPSPSDLSGDYSVQIDVTDIINNPVNTIDKTKIIDLSGTILKDAFYSFPIKPSSQYSNSQNLISDIKQLLDKEKVQTRLNNIAKNASIKGIPKLCNSFFYRREGVENCNNQLSKTGSEPIFTRDLDKARICGSKLSNAKINIYNYPYGYTCSCGEYGKKEKPLTLAEENGKPPEVCIDCTPSGEVPPNKSAEECCIYQKDKDGKVINNVLYRGSQFHSASMIAPTSLCDDNKCCFMPGEKSPDNNPKSCANWSSGWLNSSDAGTSVCCPGGSTTYEAGSARYWCNHLGSGVDCKYDIQCMSGNCRGNSSGKGKCE
jgi:hypothetical protein